MKFDFSQEFLPVNYKPLFRVYRFNIFRLTPNDLFPEKDIEYYSLVDEASGELAMFGVMWILEGKNYRMKTRLLPGRKGDWETFQYIAKVVLDRLGDRIIKDLKNVDNAALLTERNSKSKD
jgi:hypothetical protein